VNTRLACLSLSLSFLLLHVWNSVITLITTLSHFFLFGVSNLYQFKECLSLSVSCPFSPYTGSGLKLFYFTCFVVSFIYDKPPYATRTGVSKLLASPFIPSTALSKCQRPSGRGFKKNPPPTEVGHPTYTVNGRQIAGSPTSLHAPRNAHFHSRHRCYCSLFTFFYPFIFWSLQPLSSIVQFIVHTNIDPAHSPLLIPSYRSLI
jgi:hypothetical protein